MHLGHINWKIKYEMGGMKLYLTLEENDLVVILMKNYRLVSSV